MSGALYRLVYVSRNDIDGDPASMRAHVDRILEVARDRNRRARVTGALMFNGSAFAQVLEGPLEAVEETFERIQNDPRHSRVVVLDFSPAGARRFSAWSMAYIGDADGAPTSFGDFGPDGEIAAARDAGDRLVALLADHLHEAEAA